MVLLGGGVLAWSLVHGLQMESLHDLGGLETLPIK